jgi:DNA replication protein DnaC
MKRTKPRVITSGDVSRIASADSLKDSLDSGFYILEVNMQGYYLTKADPFTLPKKVYGNAFQRAERILKTYTGRGTKSMGVMCSGRPGTGKTILSKVTANMAHKMGMPVIIIRQGYFGPPISSFLESLPNQCLMFIDEIEKVYDSTEARNWLLSVLDGTVNSSHLWLSTCNNPDIGEAFESRPGRIRYHYRFENMDDSLIEGMICESIKNKGMQKSVLEMARKIQNLTPDILYSMIEECLIHNEKPEQFLEFLNVDTSLPSNFSIKGRVKMYVKCPHNIQVIEEMRNSGDQTLMNFAKYTDSNSLMYTLNDFSGRFNSKFRKSLVEFSSPWEREPIEFDQLGNPFIDFRVDIDKTSHRIEWESHEIQKIEFKNGQITVYGPERGDVIVLTPFKLSGKKPSICI